MLGQEGHPWDHLPAAAKGTGPGTIGRNPALPDQVGEDRTKPRCPLTTSDPATATSSDDARQRPGDAEKKKKKKKKKSAKADIRPQSSGGLGRSSGDENRRVMLR